MKTLELATADDPLHVHRQMAQMADALMGRHFFGFSTTDAWRPSVNLYETTDAFLVCADLAGMNEKDIEVQIDRNQLLIRGRRISPAPPGGEKPVAVHLMEIDHGTFGRLVEIPANVDADHIAAQYELGMLWITLPKKAPKKVRPTHGAPAGGAR